MEVYIKHTKSQHQTQAAPELDLISHKKERFLSQNRTRKGSL